ncbi:MAG: response regulator transcription factor [Campylobacterales bacterium]
MEINIFALKEYAEPLKVLYVEDDESVKTQIAIFLGKFFPSIVTAKDGIEGLEAYKKDKYDIVITDIAMPHMDGIEMARRIKEINEEQVVIVTSAYNETEKLMELINIGIDKFVMKPINNKPFLILLYNVAKSIHLSLANRELENKLVSKVKETEKILNFMDSPIAVIENSRVSMMNKAFRGLFGFTDIDDVSLDEVGARVEYGIKCGKDIINCLEKEPYDIHKAIVKDRNSGMRERVFLLKHAVLEPGHKYLLSFMDITQLEQDIKALSTKLHTNPFTGLPNKEALKEVVGDIIKKEAEFGSIIFYIKNLEHIIAWHGKDKGLDVERSAANELIEAIEHKHFEKKPFVANFDKNFYVAICRKEDVRALKELIASMDVASHIPKSEHIENETIHSGLEPVELDEKVFADADEFFIRLKQKYEKILF